MKYASKYSASLFASLALLTSAYAADTAPIRLPEPAKQIDVGVRKNIFPPIHISSNPATDSPVIHPMLSMFDEDQRLAGEFGETGSNNICGPTAMANSLIYLRFNHQPNFPKILDASLPTNATSANYVEKLFQLCKTDPKSGTLITHLRDCAKAALKEGNYNTVNTFIRGIHSDLNQQKFAPGPGDLRNLSRSTFRPGSTVTSSDRAITLLFGWYDVKFDEALKKWNYHRVGGHYVTLAGFDSHNPNVFYVTNPLIDYNAMGMGDVRFSKITLEPVASLPNIKTPEGIRNLSQTRDLVAGHFAVLEDLIIALPWK
jgi:hypothetical protein